MSGQNDIRTDVKVNLDASGIKKGFEEGTSAAELFSTRTSKAIREAQKAVEDLGLSIKREDEGAGSSQRKQAQSYAQRTVSSLGNFENPRVRAEMARLRDEILELTTGRGRTPDFSRTKMFEATLAQYKSSIPTDPERKRAIEQVMSQLQSKSAQELVKAQNDLETKMAKDLLGLEQISNPVEKANRLLEIGPKHAQWSEEILDLQMKRNRLEEEYNAIVNDGNSAMGTRGRMLPAYLTSVTGLATRAAGAIIDVAIAEKTMWDLSSPQSMANALRELDIYKTGTYWRGGAQAAGLAGGAIVGGALAGTAVAPGVGTAVGAIAGAFAGGAITGPIGDLIASYLNADKQAQGKLFNTLFGKQATNSQAFNTYESSIFTLMARTGGGVNLPGGSPFGLSPTDMIQYGNLFTGARGEFNGGSFRDLLTFSRGNRHIDPGMVMNLARLSRFTGREFTGEGDLGKMFASMDKQGITPALRGEFIQSLIGAMQMAVTRQSAPGDIARSGWSMMSMPEAFYGSNMTDFSRTPEGRGQIQQMMSAFTTPKSEAERAFLFTAYRGAFPQESFFETNLRMREGIFGKGNLSAALENIPPSMRQAYIMALTEGKDVNPGLVRDMMKAAGTPGEFEGFMGRWGSMEQEAERLRLDPEQRKAFLNSMSLDGKVPKGEVGMAEIAESQIEAGRKVRDQLLEIQKGHEQWLNFLSGTVEAQSVVKSILSEAVGEMMSTIKELDPRMWRRLVNMAQNPEAAPEGGQGKIEADKYYTTPDGNILTGRELLLNQGKVSDVKVEAPPGWIARVIIEKAAEPVPTFKSNPQVPGK